MPCCWSCAFTASAISAVMWPGVVSVTTPGPAFLPVGHRVAPFLDQFANEAGVTREEVPRLAGVRSPAARCP